jgi:uncharacterized protein (TIGR02246 family)
VIFQGPQAYISPSWYASKKTDGMVVPTWNYAVVHARGVPRFVHDKPWLLALVTKLTATHEAGQDVPWQVSDAPADYIGRRLEAIVGVEIPLLGIEGKWKASQNRPRDATGISQGLRRQPGANAQLMAEVVEERARAPVDTSTGNAGPSRELTDFATRYAAAWSSQDPARLASFYAEGGTLVVNGGPASTGRDAIAATAGSFMTAFPDMVVSLDRLDIAGDHPVFRWIWTGTNTGPGGTGKFVRMTGHEEWTLDANGLIAKSEGHYDEAEYQRQLKVGVPRL